MSVYVCLALALGAGAEALADMRDQVTTAKQKAPTKGGSTREKSMKLKKTLAGAVAGLALLAGAQSATAAGHGGEITVAYFLEWPMPFQFAKVNGTYEEEMGVKINWVSFDTGTAMSAAMASGDVDISVSQGVPPFVVATSAGQDHADRGCRSQLRRK